MTEFKPGDDVWYDDSPGKAKSVRPRVSATYPDAQFVDVEWSDGRVSTVWNSDLVSEADRANA